MSDTTQDVLLKLSAIDNLTPVMLKALQNMEANSAKMTEALDKVGQSSQRAGHESEEASGHHDHQALSFIALKEAGELVYEAFERVEAQFEKAIEEALAGEKATNRLTGAMISSGQFT